MRQRQNPVVESEVRSPKPERHPASSRPLRLHIERLVLEGLPLEPGAATRVREAIESELARRLAAGGLSAEFRSGGAVPSLSGGEVHWKPGLSPSELGARIAGAIHASLAGRAAVPTVNRESPCVSS